MPHDQQTNAEQIADQSFEAAETLFEDAFATMDDLAGIGAIDPRRCLTHLAIRFTSQAIAQGVDKAALLAALQEIEPTPDPEGNLPDAP